MVKLREYQTNLINNIRKKYQKKAICVVAPCGSGKSIIEGMIAKMATDKKNRVLFLVHRKELCQQIKDTFNFCGVDWTYCKIAMVQTVTRHLDNEIEPQIIITDENHHCLANSYIKIYKHFDKALKLGFTATPIRLGGKGLGPVYNDMVEGPKVDWLIKNNFLAPFVLFGVKLIDRSKLHIRNGDFKINEINELTEEEKIYGKTIKNYEIHAKGKKTIVYCSSIKASKNTTETFISAGYKACHLDAKTPKQERAKIVKEFRENKIDILCNVDLFGEGFDIPDCECVILLRPTKSLALYIQQSMRSMRYKPGKKAIIIDHVGNYMEHNLPNYDHEWSLNDKVKKKKKSEELIQECPECFAVLEPNTKICPECGFEFKTDEKPAIQKAPKKVEDIILEEITSTDVLRSKPHSYYTQCKSLDELLNFFEAKGYKSGWIYHKLEELKNNIKITQESLKRMEKLLNYKRGWHKHKMKEFGII